MSLSQDYRPIKNLLVRQTTDECFNSSFIQVPMTSSKITMNTTFNKEKKELRKSAVLKCVQDEFKDLPLSFNNGIKYDPILFEQNLRKNHNSKLDEELYKIKQYTSVLMKSEQEANNKEKEFQKIRKQDMHNYQKKIPKSSILHKIQAFHRRKCPQFDINKCLMRKKQYSEKMSREDILTAEEKKIDLQVIRKSQLQRQQDIIKRCLSPTLRQKLGIQAISQSTINDYYDESNRNINSTLVGVSGTTPFYFGSRSPSNRHQNPCSFSFHDDNIQVQLKNMQFNINQRKRASSSEGKNISHNILNQMNDYNILNSYGQNPKILSKRPSIVQNNNFMNQGNDSVNTSGIEKNNLYNNSTRPATIMHSNRRQSTQNSSYQDSEREKLVLQQQRKRRQNSPMRFLFKKYENVVNESYEDFRIEMKNVAEIYMNDPRQRKDSTASSMAGTVTDNKQIRTNNSPTNKQQSENLIGGNLDGIAENFSKQPNLSQNASQRKKESTNQYKVFQLKLKQNFQSLNTSNNTSPTQLNQIVQQENYYQPQKQKGVSSAASTHRSKINGQQKFLDQNQVIFNKNQQLNKTLYEFQKESKQIKNVAQKIQKYQADSERKMDIQLEMRKKGDSYNVSDFMMKVQDKKIKILQEQQNKEALQKKFGKVQKQNDQSGDQKQS